MTSSGMNVRNDREPDIRPATGLGVGSVVGGAASALAGRFFSHRPAAFTSMWWWLVAGMVRDWRGTIAAIFTAWFGVPAAIGLAVLAALSLGTVGYFGAAGASADATSDVPVWGDVLNNVALHLGGGLGALSGFVVGILIGGAVGLLLPWASLYNEDPVVAVLVVLLQVVLALLVGVGYLLYAVALEPLRLRVGGARRLSRREEEFLLPLLQESARRLGLANVPMLLIDDTREANALAYTRHIVVSRGLLDEFDYDESVLAGLLSHELTHWHNADGMARLFIRGVALPLYLPYAAASWVLRTFQNSIIRFIAGIVAWPIAAAVRFVVMPMQSAGTRDAEYRADRGAVLAGYRDPLRIALERFRRSFDGARNGWDAAVCATHPPNELRLEAVEEPGRRYPLPTARRKARAATRTEATVEIDSADRAAPAPDRNQGGTS